MEKEVEETEMVGNETVEEVNHQSGSCLTL